MAEHSPAVATMSPRGKESGKEQSIQEHRYHSPPRDMDTMAVGKEKGMIHCPPGNAQVQTMRMTTWMRGITVGIVEGISMGWCMRVMGMGM